MIVLSVGMPRAGSGWHYNLIHDLMKTAGAADARAIRERYRLQSILTEVNCNIGVLSVRRLLRLLVPALRGERFVIKAHAGPTQTSRILQKLGILRITYIYRDPRDAMLSAYEYGQRGLRSKRPNAFSHLADFDACLNFMSGYVHIWNKWIQEEGVHTARYEDFLSNYETETKKLVQFLGLNWTTPELHIVVDSFRPEVAEGQKGLHFYKGKTGRFRQEYGSEQQSILLQKFGKELEKMGYSP